MTSPPVPLSWKERGRILKRGAKPLSKISSSPLLKGRGIRVRG